MHSRLLPPHDTEGGQRIRISDRRLTRVRRNQQTYKVSAVMTSVTCPTPFLNQVLAGSGWPILFA